VRIVFWPESFVHRVCREVPNAHLANTLQAHASMHEEALPPRFEIGAFLISLPIQGLCAVLYVRPEDAEALVADDFQAAEASIVHVLTILEIENTGNPLTAQLGTQTHREEHRIRIGLDSPIVT